MTIDRAFPYALGGLLAAGVTWWAVSLMSALWGGYETFGVVSLSGQFLADTEASVIDRRGAVWVLRDVSVPDLLASGSLIIFPARDKTCLAIVEAASAL